MFANFSTDVLSHGGEWLQGQAYGGCRQWGWREPSPPGGLIYRMQSTVPLAAILYLNISVLYRLSATGWNIQPLYPKKEVSWLPYVIESSH